jgi:hypothetical protein
MAYVEVSCPACGQHSSVDEDVAKRMTRCPACNAELPKTEAPAEPPPPPEKPRLRLKHDGANVGDKDAPASAEAADAGEPKLRMNRTGTVGGELKLCPGCGTVLAPADIVCSMCGLNTETGHYMQVEQARRERWRRTLATVAVILIVGALGAGAWKRGWIRMPDWRSWLAPAPAPAETATPGSSAAPRTEEDIAQLAAALENTIRAQLDAESPMFERGQNVEIEMLDGQVVAGIFRGLKQDRIALVEVEGVLREVPNDRQRPTSRRRADAAFRDEWIRAEARRRAESGSIE